MKTQAQDKLEVVAQLANVIEMRKQLEKQEKTLKDQVKAWMENEAFLEAGQFFVTMDIRNRSDLDKDALQHDMGHEFVLKYTKVSSYSVMSVKPTSRAMVG